MEINIHANILVKNDFGISFDFYTKKIGLVATWGNRKGPYVSLATAKDKKPILALFKGKNVEMFKGYKQPSTDQQPDTLMFVIYTDNFNEVYEKLKTNGVEFLGEPQKVSDWGSFWCVYFRDPEGNLVGIYEGLI